MNWKLHLLITRIDSYLITCNPDEHPSWSSEPALDDDRQAWMLMISQADDRYIKQLYILILDLWHKSGILLVHGKQNLWHISSKLPKIWELPAQSSTLNFKDWIRVRISSRQNQCYEIKFDCALINHGGWFTRQKLAAPGKLPLWWPGI